MASSSTLQSTVKLKSGYEMPVLGLGVFENDDCAPACLAALHHGYRHIDTAEYYHNESQVGRAVRESGIPREEIFVTTKIYDPDHGYESTLAHVEASLTKFQFSYIDLYLIHSPLSGKERRLDTYRALLKKRDESKIRCVGVSNYGVHHLEELRSAGLEPPTVNQIELHPFCQQKPIVAYCKEHRIVIQAYSPLVRGDISHPVIQEVSKSSGRTPTQVLIRWSLQHGFIPLPKSAQPVRVVQNAEVFDFTLTEEEMAKLDSLDKGGKGAVTWNPVEAP